MTRSHVVFVAILLGCVGNQESATHPHLLVPRFEEGTQVFDNAGRTWDTALADLDGDGSLDLVLTSLESPARVLFNDGTGRFRASGQSLASHSHGVAAGDLDGDGDLDLFFAVLGREQHSPVYLNDGHGFFERSTAALSLESNERIALIDIDGDGDLDAYLWYSGRLYTNDGRGNFSLSTTALPESPEFGDLDGDGHVDVLSVLPGQGFRVYLNDGEGAFAEHGFLPNSKLLFGYVAFVDVDGDRDADVVFTSGQDEMGARPAGILLNDGGGRLVDSEQELSRATFGFVCAGDLNADGWIDVVLTDSKGPPRLWLNVAGKFEDSGVSLGVGGLWNDCTIADIDRDGDLDVFVTRVFQGNHGVWFNQRMEDRDGSP